jgi:hypothetical protein
MPMVVASRAIGSCVIALDLYAHTILDGDARDTPDRSSCSFFDDRRAGRKGFHGDASSG